VSLTPALLFHVGDLDAALDARRSEVAATVRKIDPDRILSVPVEDLVDEMFNEYVVNPIELETDRQSSPGVQDAQRRSRDTTG
jgi:hypothetical protein